MPGWRDRLDPGAPRLSMCEAKGRLLPAFSLLSQEIAAD
jgi:hypothetical protein